MEFTNGLFVIKRGRKIIAKVYDRNEFFKGTRYENSFKQFPYSIEAFGGMFECTDLEDVKRILNKHEIL